MHEFDSNTCMLLHVFVYCDNTTPIGTMRLGIFFTDHLFVGENMKKLLAFGIGGV